MKTSSKSSKSSKSVTKGFENPYRNGGNYHAIVATLNAMGANKPHKYAAFESKLISTWDGWTAFTRKEVRNEETHKDSKGKLRVNVSVCQRSDYGKPLHDQGACIDLWYEGEELMVKLNTKSAKPITPGRAPKAKAAPKSAKVIKKAARKAASPILSGSDAIAFLKSGKRKTAT